MVKIAYKKSKDNPNLPNGFITEHFETTEDLLEGYEITSIENFSILLAQNGPLLHQFEIARDAAHIRSIMASEVIPPEKLEPVTKDPDEELFKQFLAWKASQSNT